MNTRLLLLFLAFGFACSPRPYEIAYASYRDKNYDIFLATGDSTLALTTSTATEYNISWAPDGQKIYYTVYNQPNRQINSYDFATKTETVVLGDSTVRSIADVSSDNQTLLLALTGEQPKGELYLYNLATKAKTRVSNNEWVESGAKLSPDGKQVVTSIQTSLPDSSSHAGNAEIFLISLTDQSVTQLTDIKGFNALPSFSPDGKKIAFHGCSGPNCDIYVMNADGSGLRNLTENTVDSRWPRWTPDGKWIAYTRTVDSNSDIYFISPTGTKSKPVITSPHRDEIAEIRPGRR